MWQKNKDILPGFTEENLWNCIHVNSNEVHKTCFLIGKKLLTEGITYRQQPNPPYDLILDSFRRDSTTKIPVFLDDLISHGILLDVKNSKFFIKNNYDIPYHYITIPFKFYEKFKNGIDPTKCTFDELLNFGCAIGVINYITPIIFLNGMIYSQLLKGSEVFSCVTGEFHFDNMEKHFVLSPHKQEDTLIIQRNVITKPFVAHFWKHCWSGLILTE
jgi:hypothetical protein